MASSTGITGVHGYPTNTDANTCRDSGCHDAAAYTATIGLGGPTSVIHNTTSGTNFTLTGTGGVRRGFNIAIYRGTTKQTAAFSSLSAGVQEVSNELTHDARQNITSWNYRWAAPSTLGTYTIYACVNPVNNAGDGSLGDGAAACTTRNFSVSNNNPNAINDNPFITVTEDSGLSGTANVLSNDLATDGDAFSWFSHSTGSITGILQHNGNGVYQFNPNGQFESLDTGEQTTTSFTYTIRENSYPTYTDTATATIRITGVNDAPVAVNDGTSTFGAGHVTILESQVAVGVGNLLANDSDVDGEVSLTTVRTGPAACSAITPSESSSFTLNSNGTFNYTHDGIDPVTTQDSFSYCVFDGTTHSAAATVFIDITAVNDAPTINGFSGAIPFTEQTPVIVDNSIVISDTDNTVINRARLTISGGYETGDTLACASSPPAGISCGAFDVPSRTLTLSGNGSWTDYQTAVATVTFNNTLDNPSLTARTIDLDVRDDGLGISLDSQKSVTVIRTNDPPTLTAILPQVALEDAAPDNFTFTYTAVAIDPDVNDDINDGGLSTGGTPTLTYSLSGLAGALASMTISNNSPTHGQISWNPPVTGIFGQVYGPVMVLIEDGDEDISAQNSVSFSITVSPPDTDADGVANYNDFCVSVADGSNLDTDNDGLAGADGMGTIGTPQHDNSGGNVCDLDDDGDMISDVDEILNSLDPLNPLDAALDNDGDGISNIDEINNGTNPNSPNLVIDATGFLTPYTLPEPDPRAFHSAATAVTANDYGPYRPGDNTITWTPSNSVSDDLSMPPDDANLVSNPPTQPLYVRPLLNFSASQRVEKGDTATLRLSLNGHAVTYPVTVNYSVSGTATAGTDFSAPVPASGAVTFSAPVLPALLPAPQFITFNLTGASNGETVVFSIDSATNAAIGANNTHTVTVVEGNVAPQAALRFGQGGNPFGSVFAGVVDIDVLVNDVNVGQTYVYDWSGTDTFLVPPGGGASWTATPTAGNYLVDVVVTDDGLPARSTRVTRIMNVIAAAPTLLGTDDSDGDGVDDLTEGPGDSDADGIPDYLDAQESIGETNMLADQTSDVNNVYLLETEAGLRLTLGSTARASASFGAVLTDTEIASFGSPAGTPTVYPADSLQHIGGVYDFEVRGLIPGASARVVIPLQTSIPRNAVYRKFNPAAGWGDFVENNNNSIASARGAPGACPEPGSGQYTSGLGYLNNCIQLTVQDGGANDTDGAANGVVADPGAIGISLTDPEIEEVEDGGGRVSPLLLAVLLLLGGFAVGRRQRGARQR